jgi:hypothetical protein
MKGRIMQKMTHTPKMFALRDAKGFPRVLVGVLVTPENKEALVTMAQWNPKDSFDKHRAKDVVLGRLRQLRRTVWTVPLGTGLYRRIVESVPNHARGTKEAKELVRSLAEIWLAAQKLRQQERGWM